MKTYRVGFYYEEIGFVDIKASSKEEAEEYIYKELDNNGSINMDDYNLNHRNFGITNDTKELNA
jgi:hypothetical protein